MNIVSCAMLGAFLLEMPVKPTVGQAADYYREVMTTGAMKFFCRMGGKRKFTRKDIEGMKKTATLNAADRNPYSWNMTFHPYCGDASVLRQRVYADGFVFIIDNFRNMSAQYASKAEVATAVGRINHHYANTGKNLLLMAPGRVGTPSPELGVPTRFADISCFSEPLRDSAFSLWHRLRLDSGGFLEYNKGDGESVQQ